MKLSKLMALAGTLVAAVTLTSNVSALQWNNGPQLGEFAAAHGPIATKSGTVYAVRDLGQYGFSLSKWPGDQGQWEDIACGTGISTLYVNGNYLYVGGSFDVISLPSGTEITAHNIAKYNILTKVWESIPGTPNHVGAIVMDASQNLYAGLVDAAPHSGLVRLVGMNWQVVGGGLVGDGWCSVTALAASGNKVFVGGAFRGGYLAAQGDTSVDSPSLIIWDGSSSCWQAMGNNDQFVGGPVIYGIAVAGQDVFVTGYIFENHPIGQSPKAGLFHFNTSGARCPWGEDLNCTGWSHGSGLSIAADGQRIFLVGGFDRVADVYANNIAQWDSSTGTWSPLGSGLAASYPNSYAMGSAVAADAGAVYVLGSFDLAGGISAKNGALCFPDAVGIRSVSCGGNHSAGVKYDGTVWTWGYNDAGQIGNGATGGVTGPTQVPDHTGVVGVLAGYHSTYAWDNLGRLWAWGSDYSGHLGDGSTTAVYTPTQINVPNEFVIRVVDGYDHCLALTANGNVWSWGMNNYGQLGDGTTTTRLSPVQVPNLTGVVDIAAGLYYSLAVKSDGTVVSWGDNSSGTLGIGTVGGYRTTPTPVLNITNAVSVAAGRGLASLAVTRSGDVMSWGNNYWGLLGRNTTSPATPGKVSMLSNGTISALSNIAQVSVAYQHAVAVRDDGSVWTWGYINFDASGNATTTHVSQAVQIQPAGSAVDSSSGYASCGFSMLVTPNGTLRGWGNNWYGQLGIDDDLSNFTLPVDVPAF